MAAMAFHAQVQELTTSLAVLPFHVYGTVYMEVPA